MGVVELRVRVAMTLTRTTHPDSDRALESPKSPAIGLTRDGWWTDKNQRPIPLAWLTDASLCRYLGRLPDGEREKLLHFWKMTKALGKEGQ